MDLYIPFVSAALVPWVVACAYFSWRGVDNSGLAVVGLVAAWCALIQVLLLGVPGVLYLRRRNWETWSAVLILGFVAGCLPMAIWLWPYTPWQHSGYNSNGVWLTVDGAPTLAGWLTYAHDVSRFGMLGVVGASAYLVTARVMRSNNRWNGRDADHGAPRAPG